MPARLLYRDVKGREGSVELLLEPVYVGRATDCAIRSDDAMVSRRHSVVKPVDGQYWVEDLQSANGIEVNNVKVQRQVLKHNDTVRCGSLWLRFVIDGSDAPALAVPSTPPPATPASAPAHAETADLATSGEIQRLRDEVADLRERLDARQTERDTEIAEYKRLRAEHANLQRRLDDSQTQSKEHEEVVLAHKRMVEDLRDEHEDLKQAHAKIARELGEATEALASRARLLQQAQDEVAKVKQEVETQRKQIAELSKQRDDAMSDLNKQVHEVGQLRQVLHEHERLFEEQRLGLVNLEESLKELRQERQKREREMAQMRAERDELREQVSRQTPSVQP